MGSGLGYSVKNADSVITNNYTNEVIKIQTGGGSHNLFIDLYWDLGIFGVSLFITGLCIILFKLYCNIKNNNYSLLHFTIVGGALLNTLFYSLLATSPAMATLQAVLLGAICGSNRNNK
jgi:O-antigen ligase